MRAPRGHHESARVRVGQCETQQHYHPTEPARRDRSGHLSALRARIRVLALFLDGRPRLEYVRTLELLDRHLPAPPGRIPDVGGGTVVYAVPLAEPEVGDARDLSGMSERADAVLLLGPLHHLTEALDRATALAEARRIVCPGGVVVAVGISRFASLMDGLKRKNLDDAVLRPIVERDLDSGQHRNPDVRERPRVLHDRLLPPSRRTA